MLSRSSKRFLSVFFYDILMKINKIEIVAKTKWLVFKKSTYLDKANKERTWSYISRANDKKVVMIICRCMKTNKILFISQPRVTVNKKAIGFPGGLIEDDESIEDAALRELKEETGYDAEIKSVSPLLAKSTGLSDESNYLVECVVDDHQVPESHQEPTEDIEIFWKTPQELVDLVDKLGSDEYIVENDAWSFILGFLFSKQCE
ncbi:MAG: NUDIX domain-containing protein [Candidatus Lokiarchaeota archaeon]|nr:NUDIX domain-containing protein [Candidatus Lokiarchaeota archaeon]